MGVVVDTIATIGLAGYALGSTIVNGISDFFSGSDSSGYSPKASITEANSKSNADMLAELKADARNATEEKEKQILEYINKSMDKLLKILEDINKQNFGGKPLNINVAEIKRKNDDLKKEVIGFIGNYMDDRLVPSDHVLAQILKETNDKKRKKKFDNFYKELQIQAIEKLKDKVETTVHKQEEIIRKEIQNRLKEVDKSMQSATKAYEEILHMKEEQEDAKLEEKQMQYCYQYELAEILLEQLES